MEKGTIIYFNVDRAFGFISTDSGKDIYFHLNECLSKNLHEKDKVSYRSIPSKNKLGTLIAVDVQLIT